jgi:hypothetical protein
MDNGRQRAHSASSLKSLHIYGPSSKWTKRQARSTPELRLYMQQSMLSGLNTTVPQSLIPQDFARKHKPKPQSSKRKRCCTGNFCRSCCSLRLFLVFWQLILGAAITAMSFYLFFYVTDSLKVRDTPFWAGIPVCIYSIVNICSMLRKWDVSNFIFVTLSKKRYHFTHFMGVQFTQGTCTSQITIVQIKRQPVTWLSDVLYLYIFTWQTYYLHVTLTCSKSWQVNILTYLNVLSHIILTLTNTSWYLLHLRHENGDDTYIYNNIRQGKNKKTMDFHQNSFLFLLCSFSFNVYFPFVNMIIFYTFLT